MQTTWMLMAVLGGAVALSGCGGDGGGGTSHPAPVEAGSVSVPEDLDAAIARMKELLTQLDDPLKVGKELHTHRPVADELAIVAGKLGELAAKSHPPAVVATVDAKGKEIATQAARLGDALRKKNAATAGASHTATRNLVRHLENGLPRKPEPEDG